MDLSSQLPSKSQPSQSSIQEPSMSTIALQQHTLPSPSAEIMREGQQLRPEAERVELPPIRQAIPEIQLGVRHLASKSRPDTTSYSAPSSRGAVGSTEYEQSPDLHKRRRLSFGGDYQREAEQSAAIQQRRTGGLTQESQNVAFRSAHLGDQWKPIPARETWPEPSQSNSYVLQTLPAMGPPSRLDPENASRTDWKRKLPTLPHLPLDPSTPQRARAHTSAIEYSLNSSRSRSRTYPQLSTTPFDHAPSYQQPAVPYGLPQPQGEPYPNWPTNSVSQEPKPFLNSGMYPGSALPYVINEPEPDSKQRRRRGNLPKETTDLLKAWFMSHLQHPYPTEDEKQDLMKKTGLQINQISNWFINARRRRLPAMINNARAESDAKSSGVGERPRDGANDQSVERASWGTGTVEGSDGEGSIYDDEYDAA